MFYTGFFLKYLHIFWQSHTFGLIIWPAVHKYDWHIWERFLSGVTQNANWLLFAIAQYIPKKWKVDNIWIVHLQNQIYNFYQLAITATTAGEMERNYYTYEHLLKMYLWWVMYHLKGAILYCMLVVLLWTMWTWHLLVFAL